PRSVIDSRLPALERRLRLAGENPREVPVALDDQRPHQNAAEEDPQHERPAARDELGNGADGLPERLKQPCRPAFPRCSPRAGPSTARRGSARSGGTSPRGPYSRTAAG